MSQLAAYVVVPSTYLCQVQCEQKGQTWEMCLGLVKVNKCHFCELVLSFLQTVPIHSTSQSNYKSLLLERDAVHLTAQVTTIRSNLLASSSGFISSYNRAKRKDLQMRALHCITCIRISALSIQAKFTSETSAPTYLTTQRLAPENHKRDAHRHDKLQES